MSIELGQGMSIELVITTSEWSLRVLLEEVSVLDRKPSTVPVGEDCSFYPNPMWRRSREQVNFSSLLRTFDFLCLWTQGCPVLGDPMTYITYIPGFQVLALDWKLRDGHCWLSSCRSENFSVSTIL